MPRRVATAGTKTAKAAASKAKPGDTVMRAQKFRLTPNTVQEDLFRQAVGTSRFAYNWALAEWQMQYKDLSAKAEAGEITKEEAKKQNPSEAALRRQLNSIKKIQYPWMKLVPKAVVQQAIKNLGRAYINWWEGLGSAPQFKSRKKNRETARLDNGPGTFGFATDQKKVRVPVFGWIKTEEMPRWPDALALSAVLRREGERWFLSVSFEVSIKDKNRRSRSKWPQPADEAPKDAGSSTSTSAPEDVVSPTEKRHESQVPSLSRMVGIDLGLTNAITLSTGEKFEAPKPLRAALKRLKRLQREHSRKTKGSANSEKSRQRLSRAHWQVAQIRADWQHQVTNELARRFDVVFVEDLNIGGMTKNHALAFSIQDIGWGEIVRQLSYKTKVVKIGRFFPSSKKCSTKGCGHVLESLDLGTREWVCPKCGTKHDRDVNAAINILIEGLRILELLQVAPVAGTASCAGTHTPVETREMKPGRLKQEINHEDAQTQSAIRLI